MLEVGTRVKYIHEDSPEIRETGYYPPIGTAGTIVCVSSTGYQVKWDSGTIGSGIWWCDHKNVEPITTTTHMCIKCPRDKRSCNNCEYMIALNNYLAALKELEEKSDKFAAYLKKTYGIDFYH